MPVVPWVKKQRLFDARVLAAHCVHVDEGEMRTLRDARAGVAHNPTSNLKLGSGVAPVAKMLDLGLTTWAETPEPTRSDSHAWSAHPNYDLLTTVAGVEPATPGFAAVRIQPHLGSLTSAKASVATPRGLIAVSYARSGDSLTADITLPDGVTGMLHWKGKETSLRSGTQHIVD